MSRLNIHPFISFYNGSFLWFTFQAQSHFFIEAIISIVVTANIVKKNVDCFLFANSCFIRNAVSLSNNSHYQMRI